jgi:hypothetical protein
MSAFYIAMLIVLLMNVIMLSVLLINVSILYCYADCPLDECHYAECRIFILLC